MFNSISMTGTGIIVYFLSYLLSWFGLNADAGQIQGWAEALVQIGALFLLLWGQLSRQDLTMGLFRKRPF